MDGVVDDIFLLGRKYAVMILWRSDMISRMCMTTPLMMNLRKLCEYASDLDSMDLHCTDSRLDPADYVEQSVESSLDGTLQC